MFFIWVCQFFWWLGDVAFAEITSPQVLRMCCDNDKLLSSLITQDFKACHYLGTPRKASILYIYFALYSLKYGKQNLPHKQVRFFTRCLPIELAQKRCWLAWIFFAEFARNAKLQRMQSKQRMRRMQRLQGMQRMQRMQSLQKMQRNHRLQELQIMQKMQKMRRLPRMPRTPRLLRLSILPRLSWQPRMQKMQRMQRM